MLESPKRELLIPSTAGDRFFDYCLEIYEPLADPAGRLRGESLLWHSLEVAGFPPEADALLHSLRRAAGRDMTVFGIKWFDPRTAGATVYTDPSAYALSYELYYYDPQREDEQITIAGELEILPTVPDAVRYFMYSFDFDARTVQTRAVDELNVYLQFYEGQGGHSYAVRRDGLELRNTYRFHRPKLEIDAILHQVQRSLHVDFTRARLAEIVMPELFECHKICVAKKRFADAIYYSGITVDQLLWFFRRFAYPAPIVAFVEDHREGFEHLLFDVGIDYLAGPDGRLIYPKTSYYSTL